MSEFTLPSPMVEGTGSLRLVEGYTWDTRSRPKLAVYEPTLQGDGDRVGAVIGA
jgi:hypothetical protein